MSKPDFMDEPPKSEHLTDYDRAHFVTYLRLLDAEAESAHWAEVVRIIFGLDPDKQPERAMRIHEVSSRPCTVDDGERLPRTSAIRLPLGGKVMH